MVLNAVKIKSKIGLIIILLFIIVSVVNQAKYTFLPLSKSYKYIPRLLPEDDLSQLKELSPAVYQVISGINNYPQDTNFYFAPCFKDSQNSVIWWWYLYVLARHFCYPRKILCISPDLYNDNKDEYLSRYIKGNAQYADLEWVKDRDIRYIILFRNNRISILPVETDISL